MRTVALFFIGLLLLSGCKTVKEGEPALASAIFRGNTPGQITHVVDDTFTKHGYKVTRTGPSTMLCEREGSLGTKVMYGNWIGDKPVWIRVKAQLVPLEPAVFRLDCNACRVRDRGTSLEEEIPFGKLNKGHFQSILDECVKALKPESDRSADPPST